MKKFNTKEKEKIENSRTNIQNLLQAQDNDFKSLCEDLGIHNETDVNWLFDYIYNTTDESPEYTTYVKENVYGSAE